MPINVLIAGLPRLITEMLSAAVDQPPRFTLAGVTAEHVRAGSPEFDMAVQSYAPDAAIVGMHPAETRAVEQATRQHAELAVVAVSPDGSQAWNVQTRTSFLPLASISPDGIRHVLAQFVDHHKRTHEPCQTIGSTPVTEPEGT